MNGQRMKASDAPTRRMISISLGAAVDRDPDGVDDHEQHGQPDEADDHDPDAADDVDDAEQRVVLGLLGQDSLDPGA